MSSHVRFGGFIYPPWESNHTRVIREVNTNYYPHDSNHFQLGKNYLIRTTTEVIGDVTDIFGGSGSVARLHQSG